MEYGKFASAEELLKGYEELEKSFTQKCQELSALKSQQATEQSNTNEQADTQTRGTNGNPSPRKPLTQSTADDAATVPISKDADSPTNSPSVEAGNVVPPKVMTGGGNVSMALPNRPKTIKEASELAKQYFK